MDPIQRLLKTIRGVSKANPVTYIQLSEMIRTLWKTDSSGSDPDTITETTENTTVNGKHTHKLELPVVQITEIVKTIQSNNHESYLIENTVNESETVESSWSVLPYTEQVGEFKAVVMVRNKSLDTIITLMNILSFDYSDAVKVVQQNPMLTNAEITLAVGVNEANKLYATVSGMTADAKRIHLCFERCVLSQRAFDMNAASAFMLEMAATMTSYLNMNVSANFWVNVEAALSAYMNMSATLGIKLDVQAFLTAYMNINANANFELNAQALISLYINMSAETDGQLSMQALLTAYYKMNATSQFDLNFQAAVAAYLNVNSSVSFRLNAVAGLTGESIVVGGITIDDLFPTIISIVNEEMDDTIEGTYITIEAVDNVNKTVTVSWLPVQHSSTLVSPINDDMQWALGISKKVSGYWELGRRYITTANIASRTLTYKTYASLGDAMFVVGENVLFHNPNANDWELEVGSIAKKAGSFYSKQSLCVALFQHSDESYRMVINGQDSADNSWGNGLFSSSNLINWVAISDVATIKTQTVISWFANQQIRITSLIKHPTEQTKYIGLFMALISGKYEVGWIKFDENMANVEYSTAPILSSSATTSGFTSASLIHFNGKYRILVNAKYGASSDFWQLEQYISDYPEGPYSFDINVIDTTSAALKALNTSYRNGWTDEIAPFIINEKLYALIGGTAKNALGIPYLQRQWGLIEYNKIANSWSDLRKGLVAGTGFWNEHVGDYPVFFEKDGVYYLYYSTTSSTDAYVTTISRKNLNDATANLSQVNVAYTSTTCTLRYTITVDKISHDNQTFVITANGTDYNINIPLHAYSGYVDVQFPRLSTASSANTLIKTVPNKYTIGITDLTYTIVGALTEDLMTPSIAVWELDEPSGTIAYNRKAGNNGTIYGNPLMNQVGKVTNCISFDGVNDYVTIPHNTAINVDGLSASFTVSAWINSSSPTPNNANTRIMEKRAASGAYPISWAPLYATDNLMIAIYNGTSSQSINIPKASVFDGNWHLVMQVMDFAADTFAVYVDNVLIQSIPMTLTGSTANSANFNINATGAGSVPSAVKINQVALFNKALTANERAVLYNSGNGHKYSEW